MYRNYKFKLNLVIIIILLGIILKDNLVKSNSILDILKLKIEQIGGDALKNIDLGKFDLEELDKITSNLSLEKINNLTKLGKIGEKLKDFKNSNNIDDILDELKDLKLDKLEYISNFASTIKLVSSIVSLAESKLSNNIKKEEEVIQALLDRSDFKEESKSKLEKISNKLKELKKEFTLDKYLEYIQDFQEFIKNNSEEFSSEIIENMSKLEKLVDTLKVIASLKFLSNKIRSNFKNNQMGKNKSNLF